MKPQLGAQGKGGAKLPKTTQDPLIGCFQSVMIVLNVFIVIGVL